MTSIGTIHIKKSLFDNDIPESTTALTNTSTENAKKYHAAGLPYYKSGNNILLYTAMEYINNLNEIF